MGHVLIIYATEVCDMTLQASHMLFSDATYPKTGQHPLKTLPLTGCVSLGYGGLTAVHTRAVVSVQ